MVATCSTDCYVDWRQSKLLIQSNQFPSLVGLQAMQKQSGARRGNLLFKTLLTLHWRAMLCQLFWVAEEVAVRLVAPVLLRELLRWLRAADKSEVGGPHKGKLLRRTVRTP